jgi:hypothetical protein
MSIDQIIHSAYQRNSGHVGSQYKLFYSEEQEADDEGSLLEPTAADPITAPTIPAKDPKVPQAPTDPAAAPTEDPKAPADPLDPKDTVGTATPPATGGAGEQEVVKAMVECLGQHGNIKLDKMVEELKKKGYDARISDTGTKGGSGFQRGTIEIVAKDGSKVTFKDEDGDSSIGMVDTKFRDAVKTYMPEKYDELVQKSNSQQKSAGHANKVIGADGTAQVDSKSAV